MGLSRSRNIALARARTELVVLLDDDCLVTENWLDVLIGRLLRSAPRTVVTGRVLAGVEECAGAYAPSLHVGERAATYRGRVPVDPLATFNLAFRASEMQSLVGPFDDRLGPGTPFPAAEDNDWGHRLLSRGGVVVFEPLAVVVHRAWRSPRSYVSLRYAYGRGQGAYYAKHLLARDAYMLVKLANALRRRLITMTRGGLLVAVGELAWLAGWCVGCAHWVLLFGPANHPLIRHRRS